MVIDQYRFIGYDFPFFDYVWLAMFGLVSAGAWVYKKRPPYGWLALIGFGIACLLFHLPTTFLSSSFFLGMTIGTVRYFLKQDKGSLRISKFVFIPFLVICSLPLILAQNITVFTLPRTITLTNDRITDSLHQKESFSRKGGLIVADVKYSGSWAMCKISEGSQSLWLSRGEVFANSSGRIYTIADIGQTVAKWADVPVSHRP